MADHNPATRQDPNQNIDDQVVLNQSPDALVVFLNLDDRGLPIRDLTNASIVPDIDDVMSINLQMGSTGVMGKFTLMINNDNSKYLTPDNMELEIAHLNAGVIVISTTDGNKIKYNTLPAGVTWGDVKTFLNRTAYNRIRDVPPVIYLYFRAKEKYDVSKIDALLTSPTTKEELKKGKIKYRIIPKEELEEFAKADSLVATQKGDSTDSPTKASPITTKAVNDEKAAAAFADASRTNQDSIDLATDLTQRADIAIETQKVAAWTNSKPDVTDREEVSTETTTSSQFTPSAGREDTTSTLSAQINQGSLTLEEAKELFEKARPHSAFFEEFGGKLEHGRCMFEPMQLCMVFMNRRFRDIRPTDDMILTFSGYVDSVSDGFDGFHHTLTIMGSDVTKLMHITQANINPSLFNEKLPGAGGYKIWQNRFGGLEGWEIIKLLTVGGELDQEDGEGRIHGAGTFEIRSIVTNEVERTVGPNDVEGSSIYDPHVSRVELLNGVRKTSTESLGEAADKIERLFFTTPTVHIQTLPYDNSPVNDLQSYDVFKKIFGMSFGNWQNDYQSHYEIAVQVARLTNYEFYADANGHIWYHQPRFHNYHILTHENPEIYLLRDEDILNCNLTESDQQVITSVYVTGAPNFYTGPKEPVKMVGFYEDPSLVLKYGRRMVPVTHPYVVSEGDINFFARSYLVRANAGRYVGTVTVLGRPEIRMHMPIYIPFRNMIYYVEGITHTFTMGQQFTTTLKLRYGRKPWEVLPEILDYSEAANPLMSAQAGAKEIRKPTVTEILKDAQKKSNTTDVRSKELIDADQLYGPPLPETVTEPTDTDVPPGAYRDVETGEIFWLHNHRPVIQLGTSPEE